jgi:hypothetical protein
MFSPEAPLSPAVVTARLPAVKEVLKIIKLNLNPVFALSPGQGCRIVDVRLPVETTPAQLQP